MSNDYRMGIPPRPPLIYWVHTVGAAEECKFLIYSDMIEPVWTHYDNGQTCPCYEDHAHCKPKHSLLNLRWKGYLFGFNYFRREVGWIQLTQEAANQLADCLAQPQSLRGIEVTVQRSAKRKGRLSCHVSTTYAPKDLSRIGDAPDVRPSLFNMWKLPMTKHPFTQVIDRDPPTLEMPGQTG